MQTKLQSRILGVGKIMLAGAALAGFLLFTGAPRLRADDDACQKRISRADHRLHEAIEHHGRESKQAGHARHELHEAREYCWHCAPFLSCASLLPGFAAFLLRYSRDIFSATGFHLQDAQTPTSTGQRPREDVLCLCVSICSHRYSAKSCLAGHCLARPRSLLRRLVDSFFLPVHPVPRPIIASIASPMPNMNWAKLSRTTATTAARPIIGAINVTKPTKRARAIPAITGTGTATIATSAAITTVTMSTVTVIIAILTASATTAASAIGTAIGTNGSFLTMLRRPEIIPAASFFRSCLRCSLAGLKPDLYKTGRPLSRKQDRPEGHGRDEARPYNNQSHSGGGFVQVGGELVGEDGLEAPGFVLIVQHDNGHYAQGLAAGAAVGDFALQILQKAVCKMILRPLAAGILLSPFAAVGTDVLDGVLLRIAVQSGPAGAAHADHFRVSPFHGFFLLGIHVHDNVMRRDGCTIQAPNIFLFHHLRNLRHFRPSPSTLLPLTKS